MRPPGNYKIAGRRNFEPFEDPFTRSERRSRLIVESIQSQILDGEYDAQLRIRRIFSTPREIFRLELEMPELGYQRTTLLDREALEHLLEADEVRALVSSQLSAN